VIWPREPYVGLELPVDVLQTRRNLYAFAHGECETVCLSGAVIRILTQDEDFGANDRCEVERSEDVFVGWIHRVRGTFPRDKRLQIFPVRLLEFASKNGIPIGLGCHEWPT
jgi:hypothetical protein